MDKMTEFYNNARLNAKHLVGRNLAKPRSATVIIKILLYIRTKRATPYAMQSPKHEINSWRSIF